MPDDSKNKLAGMIAMKQKANADTPRKPASSSAPSTKEPPKPDAVGKLMAARKDVKVQKRTAAPAKPSAPNKMEAAKAGVRKVPAEKPAPAPPPKPQAGNAPVAKPAAKAVSPKPATPKPAPPKVPRKPAGPGMFSRLLTSIQEEFGEIKRELSAKHLFKPIMNSLSSVKKGASYLKERLAEDSATVKDSYREIGSEAGKLKPYDRSNPDRDIASIEDERKQARQFGAAFEQIGAIRGREVRNGRGQASQADVSQGMDVPPDVGSMIDQAEAGARTGVQGLPEEGRGGPAGSGVPPPPEYLGSGRPSGSSVPPPPDYLETGGPTPSATSAPVTEAEIAAAAVDRESRQIGKAFEKMGSMRKREHGSHQGEEGEGKQERGTREAFQVPLEEGRSPGRSGASRQDSEIPASAGINPPEPRAREEAASTRVPEPPGSAATQDTLATQVSGRAEVPTTSAETASGESRPSPPTAPSPKKKGAGRKKASMTEIQIRSIRSLQILYGDSAWNAAIIDPAFKPSRFYLPRKGFEENFADLGFRNAMKAASRIAIPFGSEWRGDGVFDQRTIEDILKFEFPPVKGNADPDEKQIAAKCGKEIVKRIEGFVESDEVKRLLRDTGGRLNLFVPTLEIIARIYLALKKGNDMDPKARMDIQKAVMFKYQKAKYPEKSARKARNVALKFFFEYLVDYGLEVYKDRKGAALEMKTTTEIDLSARFESLRDVACNLAAERAMKAALSAQVITELREQIRSAISNFDLGIEPGSDSQSSLEGDEEEGETPLGSAESAQEGSAETPAESASTPSPDTPQQDSPQPEEVAVAGG